MVNSPSAGNGHAVLNELVGEVRSILLDLDNIFLELRGHGLLELSGDTSNLVLMGSSLKSREDSLVDAGLKISLVLSEEDKTGAGATEGLVGRGGDNVAPVEGVGRLLGDNKTTDVSHVHHEKTAVLIGNLTESLVVPLTGVSRPTHDQALGLEEPGVTAELLQVNKSILVTLVG